MRKLKREVFLSTLVAALFVWPVSSARAQWIPDGAAICTTAGSKWDPRIVSDGAGGAIITWYDFRSGPTSDVYAQLVDASGNAVWTAGGVALCTAAGDQENPRIVSDGEGGAIVTWQDYRSGTNHDIYIQRVDASGAVQWTADGVPLCTATGSQQNPAITSDGAGGAIVTWQDPRGGNNNIYAQRVDTSGAVQWTANGVALCTASLSQEYPRIVSDGAGGAIVTWQDYRWGEYNIYARRVDASGAVLWTADGVALCTALYDQEYPEIVSDGAGGAIVTWQDPRGGSNTDIYAQRVDATGAVRWTADGEVLCTATGYQFDPAIASDGEGGAIATWFDYRSGTNYDIYAQRADSSGSIQWTADGVALCTATGNQAYPTVAPDGAGGAIVTWQDPRSGNNDIYAQRVDSSGAIQWTADGVALCTATGIQELPVVVSDGAGGAIVTWQDLRSGDCHIYAQRIFGTGVLGHEVPHIESVMDVPNDQGGKIELQWDRCFILEDPDPTITYYSVWRRLPQAMPALATESSDIVEVSIDFGGVAYRALEGSSDYAWEWLANIPVKRIDTYAYMVESRYDSTSSDVGWQCFVVTGHTDNPFVYYDSPPDSGYSVDNLSPCPPAVLAAEYMGSYQLYIHWSPNLESDLSHYAIYRGTTPDFVPDETNRMDTATDTSCVDDNFGYNEYYYKVSAIDVHENESLFALLTPDMIAGVPGEHPRYANVLFQNAPNPFLSSTRIAFSTKKTGHVRLRVFDAKGRLVRVLLDELRRANRYVESWDGRDKNGRLLPAGTYFYSLQAPGWTASKKMTLAR